MKIAPGLGSGSKDQLGQIITPPDIQVVRGQNRNFHLVNRFVYSASNRLP